MILTVATHGSTDIIDITDRVVEVVERQKVKEGSVNIFVKGSTAAITTIEVDENLYEDLKEVLEEIIPIKRDWKHHKTWSDDNGGSHLRAAIFGPSLTIPIITGQLTLGTWQKIVLIDFDTQARTREVIVTCLPSSSAR